MATTDRVTIGVTHEATINGDRAWIKFEYSRDVADEAAVDALNKFVQSKSVEIIESTAKTVMDYADRNK